MRKVIAITLTALVALGSVASGVAASAASPSNGEAGARITTDKTDYRPGQRVTISGRGFTAHESIQIELTKDGGVQEALLSAVADGRGAFVNRDYVPGEEDRGAKYQAVATGQSSGNVARAEFTDGIEIKYGPAAKHFDVTAGGAAGTTGAITVTFDEPLPGTPTSAITLTPSVSKEAVCDNGTGPSCTGGTIRPAMPASFVVSVVPVDNSVTVKGDTCTTNKNNVTNCNGGNGDNGNFTVNVTAPSGAAPGIYAGLFKISPSSVPAATASQYDNNGATKILVTVLPPADITPPTTSISATVPDANNAPVAYDLGWTNKDVTVTIGASDTNGVASIWYNIDEGAYSQYTGPFVVSSEDETRINYYAVDIYNNTGEPELSPYTIKIDKTAPVVTAPSSIGGVEASGAGGSLVEYEGESVTDNLDSEISVSCVAASNSTFVLGTTTVTCSATDHAGNTGAQTFSIEVVDTTAPTISGMPADITEEATSPAGAAVSWSAPTASDIVDGGVAVSCDKAPGAFALGTVTVTCTAEDAAGNEASDTFTVTVEDTTDPSLTVSDDITGVEATGPDGATVNYTAASATDIADANPVVSCGKASGTKFAIGTTIVNCTATDASGNQATDSFNVTVVDTTKPTVSVPSNITGVEATGPGGAQVTYSGQSASDSVDGALTPTCDPTSGSTFAIGTTTVTCSATDNAGNTGSATFTVQVVDTTGPVLSLPSNITMEATGASTPVSFTATSSDVVDGARTVTCTPASGSGFSVGTVTVNCSASDSRGNTSNGSFKVTITDTTKPSLSLPANINAVATLNSQAAVNFTATATDLVDGSVTVSCSPASGSLFAVGTTTVNCSATDSHSNQATGSFTVTVGYSASNFLRPVDMAPIVNRVKAGSAVPVKFSLNGNQGLNIFAAGYPGSVLTPTIQGAIVDDLVEVINTAGGSSLSYDALTDQYTYVWKTDKAWAGTSRQLQVKFKDGTIRWANFTFTK